MENKVIDEIGKLIYKLCKELYIACLLMFIMIPIIIVYGFTCVIGFECKSLDSVVHQLCKHLNKVDT